MRAAFSYPNRRGWSFLLWAGVAAMLFFALRDAPLAQIAAALSRLHIGQILVLVLVNAGILLLMNVRWWLLLHSFGYSRPITVLLAYRLAAFGISYFTPGPQFGGEPVQVHLLNTRQSVPLPAAISSVFLDRLLDLLSNFTFLVVGTLVITLGNRGGSADDYVWLLAVLLLLFPLLHLLALWRAKKPATRLLGLLHARFQRPFLAQARDTAEQSEAQIELLLWEKPAVFAGAAALSLAVWAAFVFEFWLCLNFIGIMAGPQETVGALTAARLAYLLPFPGGLGAFEASQSIAARMLGWSPAAAIALTLVIRARDIFLGLLGLWIAGTAYRTVLLRRISVRERRL